MKHVVKQPRCGDIVRCRPDLKGVISKNSLTRIEAARKVDVTDGSEVVVVAKH